MSQRQDALRALFYQMKAASENMSACIQNDAPTLVLQAQLEEARLKCDGTFREVERVLQNLDSLGGFEK